jgi:outer membrane protein OmpA-like peptidoglycan-associated protein
MPKHIFISIVSFVFLQNVAFANVVGSDHQNFNPTTNGIDFVTVQSGQTLDPGILNIGFFTNYAVNTLSFLEEADPTLKQNRTELNDTLWSADFNAGFGLTKNWDIGVSFPVLLRQDIENNVAVAYFNKTGNTEQRFNTKYRFRQTTNSSWAAVLSVGQNNIKNNPYTGGEPGPTVNLELASSWKRGDWWFGANAGRRWRDEGKSLAATFNIDPTPDQWIYSLAASRHIPDWDVKWITELYGSQAASDTGTNLSNRDYENLELLTGLKWDQSENLALHAGLGTEIIEGFGSPDYRVYAGLNYVIGPLFEKESIQEDPREEIPEEPVRKFTLLNLRFKFDSDELEEESVVVVEAMVAIIKSMGTFERIRIEGHTDSMGGDVYNLQLSQTRADAVVKYLSRALKVDQNIFEGIGRGETMPVADNGNFQGRAQNRRVVVTIFTKSKKTVLSK